MYRDKDGFVLPCIDDGQVLVFDHKSIAGQKLESLTKKLSSQLGPVEYHKKGPWWKFWDPLILVIEPNPLQEFQRQNIQQILNTVHVKTVKVI
ncbi:Dda.1 conserved hypothetical protein [Acinetobacter phage 133]|uniref:Uncharacterized protein dda.1 n=1 Tax=Acinetobacter phage 133 TaxID=2919552 RepID=D9I5Y4_9CAUD|nr:Dda.1 conserved hypothetical protein [Acinetobacter phage 133]ADJ19365.1 Dda.1 conserved hypothetical protein [Acinetobacter phage 133]